MPTKDIIEKRAGKLIEEFKALLCPNAGSSSGYKRGPVSETAFSFCHLLFNYKMLRHYY